MKLDKLLLLNPRRVWIIAGIWLLSVLLHNAIYALFYDNLERTGDEKVFFTLAVIVIPLYLVISLVYTVRR